MLPSVTPTPSPSYALYKPSAAHREEFSTTDLFLNASNLFAKVICFKCVARLGMY